MELEQALELERAKPLWITKLNQDGTIMWEGEYEDFHKGNIIVINPFLEQGTMYVFEGVQLYSSKGWYRK